MTALRRDSVQVQMAKCGMRSLNGRAIAAEREILLVHARTLRRPRVSTEASEALGGHSQRS